MNLRITNKIAQVVSEGADTGDWLTALLAPELLFLASWQYCAGYLVALSWAIPLVYSL